MTALDPSLGRPFTGRRFWLWYWLVWLDLALLFFVVYLITGVPRMTQAIVPALANALPMGLLGIGVVAIFRRTGWTTERYARFVPLHVVLAAVFGVGSTTISYGLYAVHRWYREGVLAPPEFNMTYFTWESVMGMMIYGVLAGVCYAILLHRGMREQEARAARATQLRTEAELKALRAQLNPHFLFNTLHTLLALVRGQDRAAAEEALEQFGDLLRYTLDTQQNGEEVPLREELTFVENYLALESLRLADRLQLTIDVDRDALDEPVPAFCIQPLVENAVKHAVAPRVSGGRVSLTIGRRGDALHIEVADDGPGAASAELEQSGGLGLRLVRERLAARYGERASFEVDSGDDGGFAVKMRIPIAGDDA